MASARSLPVANISLLKRERGMVDEEGALLEDAAADTLCASRSIVARRHLAQLWAVLAAIHATLASDGRCTQRELWYRLKTTGMFASGPPLVNDRVLDACAAVSFRCGAAIRRETLGVIAAPRGQMTGCITLLATDGSGAPPRPLDDGEVFQVPGDTELVRSLRFAAGSRARVVLVVEKDSIFRRLVADRFTERLPSVLITASGYPDLATRALVGSVVGALGVRCFALTDYNPHGSASATIEPPMPPNHQSPRRAANPSSRVVPRCVRWLRRQLR